MITLVLWLAACGGKDESDDSGTVPADDSAGADDSAADDSAADDSATDDSATDDSATDDSATDDSATDDSGCPTPVDWFLDADHDTYGAGSPTSACDAPTPDWVNLAQDCDDSDGSVHPGATEVCNEIDDDCDFDVDLDDVGLVGASAVYVDGDADGFGDKPITVCDTTGTAAVDGDCDDTDAAVNPAALETCNYIDDDCDAQIDLEDKGGVDGAFKAFADVDGDGYGAAAGLFCFVDGTAKVDGDCDDSNAAVNPDASEVCNFVDDDCDLLTDNDDPTVEPTTSYPDLDGDGYGDPAGSGVEGCPTTADYAPNGDDCNDTDGSVYPGAIELCDDIQQNCATKGWTEDTNVATFYPATGGWEDWTADMAAGVAGLTARIDIVDDGQLQICDGFWYVDIEVTTDNVAIVGQHGNSVTTLSGGGVTRTIGMNQSYGTLSVQGVTLTDGNSCFGSSISNLTVTCSALGGGGGWTTENILRLDQVRIENNPLGWGFNFGAIYWNTGTVIMENTTISNNAFEGLEASDSTISCVGDPGNDAGIWGNVTNVYLQSTGGIVGAAGPYIFESNGCDFDGGSPSPNDVKMTSWSIAGAAPIYDYGDDASFSCDPGTLTCF